jgi:GH15 family glucan-1,4-alpha-glucosidase
LAAMGRHQEARAIFDAMLSCRNNAGLLSEDIDPATGELWGNYPQTYSLVGIINSAVHLSRTWEEVI